MRSPSVKMYALVSGINNRPKPKTNWHLVIWPIIVLWIGSAIYVFSSEWKEQAIVVLPIFMAVTAFIVCLLNAIAGSVVERRYQLRILDESTVQCTGCGIAEGPLHVVDYHSYLFLVFLVVQFGQRGKFCRSCARAKIDGMFRRTLYGALLCPPIIAWAWWQRRKILTQLEKLPAAQ